MLNRLRCWWYDHCWKYPTYEDAVGGWFYEVSECSRCHTHRRELVASKMG